MIAAIYARKSTDQSGVADEQRSVARQLAQAHAYAAQKGWTVDDTCIFVDDGISGAEFANRPGFLRLMNALKPRPRFQVLIMSEESRLGREAIETAYALKQLVTAGVRVFFYLEDRERTLDTPTDKIMLSLTTFADELEREKARQRTADAMLRKARAGHVTGGRVFGYENVDILDAQGRRSHVERRINEREAQVVRRIFEMSAAGQGVRSIAKQLNDDREPAPRAQQGRPVAWAPSSVWAVLRRPLYGGEVVWNQTRKRNAWGQKQQQRRAATEHLRRDAPELRIVSQALWTAAHARLEGAKADYIRATGGRTWGRPTNGTESKYLLTGLAQCGLCNGGLFVYSRRHGGRRAQFYGCSTYYHRGKSVCTNSLGLPLKQVEAAVLNAFEEDLLNAEVIDRALSKVLSRLSQVPEASATQIAKLEREALKVRGELNRLTEALADGGDMPSILKALRGREQRSAEIAEALAAVRDETAMLLTDVDAAMPEVRRRIVNWCQTLREETPQARQMLRTLLEGRLVFTPKPEARAYHFAAQGSYASLFCGMIDSQALASPTGFEPVFWP